MEIVVMISEFYVCNNNLYFGQFFIHDKNRNDFCW